MSQNGDPKTSTTVLIGIASIILLLVVVVFVIALFQNVQYLQTVQKIYDRPYAEVRTLHAQQQENLYSYRWINKQAGVVGIPINQAITLTVRDLKAGRQPNTIQQPAGGPASAPVETQP